MYEYIVYIFTRDVNRAGNFGRPGPQIFFSGPARPGPNQSYTKLVLWFKKNLLYLWISSLLLKYVLNVLYTSVCKISK